MDTGWVATMVKIDEMRATSMAKSRAWLWMNRYMNIGDETHTIEGIFHQ